MESEQKRLGDFEIVREIGRGGMGVVYEAIQLSLDRRVALKVLPWGLTSTDKDVARFRREAEAAGRLHHSNIVPIYAQGEHHGTYYYAMQFIEGRSLNKVIADTRGFDFSVATPAELVASVGVDTRATALLNEAQTAESALEDAPKAPPRRTSDLGRRYFHIGARMVAEVAEALDYAHGEGVVHRDIKPHNLMLTPEGRLMVTDFGLARFLDQPGVSVSGEMLGTPVYMSPEQVAAQRVAVDHRTDIYSLGVTLYELLALRVPFEGDTREAVLQQILVKEPKPLRRLSRRIPKDLETICLKAMEKDPDRRYQRAGDVARDLRAFAEGLPISARPIGPVGRLYRRAQRRRALTAALVAALLALIAGAVFGVRLYRASGREIQATRFAEEQKQRAEAESRAREIEAAAKREVGRWRSLIQAHSLVEARRYEQALERLKEAASVRYDYATHLAFWHLASLYSDRPLSTFVGHTDVVHSVAFSPDGRTLASGSKDNTIKLWDMAKGTELSTLAGHTGFVRFVAFSPSGSVLASGSDDETVKFWDVATGRDVRTLVGSYPGAVTFSPDGKTLASASESFTIKLWDTASGQELRTLSGHTDSARSVAFGPDGMTVASGGADKTIRLWNVATGRELGALGGHTDVRSVAFGPDGTTIASGGADKTIRLWSLATGRELQVLTGHGEAPNSVAFSPDGRILASTSWREVKLWDVVTGREVHTFGGGGRCAAFSADGKTLASGAPSEHILRLWDVARGRGVGELSIPGRRVDCLALSPDGKTLASGWNSGRPLRLWDMHTGRELQALAGHTSGVRSVAFSPEGTTLASGSADGTMKLWDVLAGQELRTFSGHTDIVNSLAFSPDGRMLASGSDDKTVKFWEAATGELRALREVGGPVYSVAFSARGNILALARARGEVMLGVGAPGGDLRPLLGHVGPVLSLAFSPDGKTLASAGADQTIKLREAATGRGLFTLAGHADYVVVVAFSPDGRTLASGSRDGTLRLWDVAAGAEVITIGPLRRWSAASFKDVCGVVFGPDGRKLACAVGSEILIYDLHAYDQKIERWLREAGVEADLTRQ